MARGDFIRVVTRLPGVAEELEATRIGGSIVHTIDPKWITVYEHDKAGNELRILKVPITEVVMVLTGSKPPQKRGKK